MYRKYKDLLFKEGIVGIMGCGTSSDSNASASKGLHEGNGTFQPLLNSLELNSNSNQEHSSAEIDPQIRISKQRPNEYSDQCPKSAATNNQSLLGNSECKSNGQEHQVVNDQSQPLLIKSEYKYDPMQEPIVEQTKSEPFPGKTDPNIISNQKPKFKELQTLLAPEKIHTDTQENEDGVMNGQQTQPRSKDKTKKHRIHSPKRELKRASKTVEFAVTWMRQARQKKNAQPQLSELGNKALLGDIDMKCPSSSKVVRIFTSSTFTDTKNERNMLMKHAYPRVKEHCRRLGYDFQVVDMRWGVRDEAKDDHMTTELCLKELKLCQEVSTGPNFVSLMSHKYGYTAFPRVIEALEFEKIMEGTDDEETKQLFQRWYNLDNNAMPPAYTLSPISSRLPDFLSLDEEKKKQAKTMWAKDEKQMQQCLQVTAPKVFDNDKEKARTYIMSVTEAEVTEGLLKSENPSRHSVWFKRNIEDIDEQESSYLLSRFKECPDSGETWEKSQAMLMELTEKKIEKKLSSDRIYNYNVKWNKEEGISPDKEETHQAYLIRLCKDFVTSMKEMIDAGVAERANTDGPLMDECCQHIRFCQSKCEGFYGRQETLELIKTYVQGSSSEIMVLHGTSGCGKTSIMAKAAKMMNEWMKNSPALVLRFLGTSSDSSSLVPLLKSLTSQIHRIYKEDRHFTPTEESLYDVTREFKDALKLGKPDKPLVLMLDSIDQLDPSYDARKLDWLTKELAPGTKVIVSTLPEPAYECFPALQSEISSESNFVSVPEMDTTDVRAILDNWLTMRQRRLTDNQLAVVLDAFRQCPSPLFLKLSFEEAATWTSFLPLEKTVLQNTVRASIDVLFQKLEKVHGQVLVSRSLGYLTIAKNGATEAELEDILSCDEDVLNDVYMYWTPPVRRLPPLLLVRVRQDLSKYLVERGVDGVHVIYWYHRQFIEAADARYCSNNANKRLLHEGLADFFNGTWANGKKKPYTNAEGKPEEEDRLVSSQPLKFGGTNYNMRALNNLSFHRINAEQKSLLKEQCLANPSFLVHKLEATSVDAVCKDYAMARQMFPEDEFFNDVLQALNLSKGPMAFDARQLIPQLLQRLDRCTATKQLLERCREYPSIYMLPNKCLVTKAGEQLIHYVPAHQGEIKNTRIKHIAMTADGKRLLTETMDSVKIWDVDNGTQKRTVKGLDQVTFCNNDKWLVGQDKNRMLSIQTLDTGVNVMTLSNEDVLLCITSGKDRTFFVQFKDQACTVTNLLAHQTEKIAPITFPQKFEMGKQSQASASGDYVAITSNEKTFITVLDLKSQQFLPSFRGFPEDTIREIVISPNEPYIIYTQTLSFKDIVFSDFKGTKLRTLPNPRKRHYCSPNITPDGNHLYISDSKDAVYFFDTKTLQEVGKLNQWHDKAICHDISKLVTGTNDGYLRIWDMSRFDTSEEDESTKYLTKLDKSSETHTHKLNNPRYVLGVGNATEVGKLMLEVYDVFQNAGVRWGQIMHNERYVKLSRVIATKNDQHVILVLGLTKIGGDFEEWRIVRVNLQTMTIIKIYVGCTGLDVVKMAADTEEVLCTSRCSRHMKLYDKNGDSVIVMKAGQEDKIKHFEVNIKGSVSCASTTAGFMLYDLIQKKYMYNIKQDDVGPEYIINSEGTRLVYKVSGEGGEPLGICIWDIQARSQHKMIYDIQYATHTMATYELDDTRFLTSSFDGDLFVWSIATGEKLAQMCGHTGRSDAYTHTKSPYIFSEKYNKWLGRKEDRFLLWDKASYRCVASYSLLEEKEDEDVLGWSTDGKFLLTHGKTPTVWRIYNGNAHTNVQESDYPEVFSQKDETAETMVIQDCDTETDPDTDVEDTVEEYEDTYYDDDSYSDEDDYTDY